jgi:hypothetical protein
VLRGIIGPKRDKIIGGLKKLHSEKLHNLYSSPNIIRRIKSKMMIWVECVARMGKRSTYEVLGGKLHGKRPLGRPRLRCEHNIKINIRTIVRGC